MNGPFDWRKKVIQAAVYVVSIERNEEMPKKGGERGSFFLLPVNPLQHGVCPHLNKNRSKKIWQRSTTAYLCNPI
jgi:hypothetical protein